MNARVLRGAAIAVAALIALFVPRSALGGPSPTDGCALGGPTDPRLTNPDGDRSVHDTGRNGAIATRHVFAGDARIASVVDVPTTEDRPTVKLQFFYHSDHLQSVQFISDGRGQAVEHHEVFPFGEEWISESAPSSAARQLPVNYRFNGHEFDEETALHYFGARYYDARVAQWVSGDPAITTYWRGEHSGGVFSGSNLAAYGFSWNGPLVFRDPNGRQVYYNDAGAPEHGVPASGPARQDPGTRAPLGPMDVAAGFAGAALPAMQRAIEIGVTAAGMYACARSGRCSSAVGLYALHQGATHGNPVMMLLGVLGLRLPARPGGLARAAPEATAPEVVAAESAQPGGPVAGGLRRENQSMGAAWNTSITPSGRRLREHAFESLERHGFGHLREVDQIIEGASSRYMQADGAHVYVQQAARNRFNFVVVNQQGEIVTGMLNKSSEELRHFAAQEGWTAAPE